ncbi:hypothetical protein KFL_003180100 [Klebsormidium nitens]|uniref:CCHC-type domain-containing protein n=1 Tax=Klebsormidium nitens TaxID=105231 RepID=A0A1Y1IBT5_KLENI|nr:hypothetical protein KFL_003180100 [Klebsormidium nitens]|eukprot:GAQ86889.1 hypothetical protein KFL_003180100 [Klebsormidium nitens]
MACGICGQEGHNRRTCGGGARPKSSQSSSVRRPIPDSRSSVGRHCSNCGLEGHNIRTCEYLTRAREEPPRGTSRRQEGPTTLCGVQRCVEVSARDMKLIRETNSVGLRLLRAEVGNREMSTRSTWNALKTRGFGLGFSKRIDAEMDHMHAQARGGNNRLSNYCVMPGAINGSLGALPRSDQRVLSQCGCA